MPAPSTETPGVHTSGVRRPAGVSRLGLAVASLATAGTLAVAFIGLGGPPAPKARATLGPVDTTTAEAAAPQVVVKTIYVQLPTPAPAPTAAPAPARVTATPKAVSRVVTSQSGSGGTKGGEGGEGGEQEGDD
jgi:hypothetical protein